MADKNYLMTSEDFEEGEDPHKITNLKSATYRQLKNVQVVVDYVFCTLLTSSRLNYLDPAKLQKMGAMAQFAHQG